MDALLRASSLLNSGQSERPIYSMGMSPLLLPFQLLLLMFAGWVNRHQLDVIEKMAPTTLSLRIDGR
jgi:hypothetical protein